MEFKRIKQITDFCKLVETINRKEEYLKFEKKAFDSGSPNRGIYGLSTFEELYKDEIEELDNLHYDFIVLFQCLEGVSKSISKGLCNKD